jgi:hypothetical protein
MASASELQELGRRLVGSWSIQATHVKLPGERLTGASDVGWLGDGFLVHRTHLDHPEMPDALSVLGEQMHYFDVRGVHRLFDLIVTADGWSIFRPQHGDDFGQRMTYVFEGDDEMRGQSELSHDGMTWEDDLEVVYRRAGS